jgi:hypothetical protein
LLHNTTPSQAQQISVQLRKAQLLRKAQQHGIKTEVCSCRVSRLFLNTRRRIEK